MKSRVLGLNLAPVAATLIACGGNVYDVASTPAKGGVPFLPIESVDVDKTVYEQSWLEVDVVGTFQKQPVPQKAGAKPVDPPKFTKAVTAYTNDITPKDVETVRKIYGVFVAASDSARGWDASGLEVTNKIAANELRFLPPDVFTDITKIQTLPRVSVDHARTQLPAGAPLYMNARVPLGVRMQKSLSRRTVR